MSADAELRPRLFGLAYRRAVRCPGAVALIALSASDEGLDRLSFVTNPGKLASLGGAPASS
jgi:hypothetical protein